MTFTQLEVFAALARVGSFSRAASVLGMTQSGVSHAIKQLEVELGLALLSREGAAATPTDVGARLLARANDILQQKEALIQEANAELGIARGTLRIASFGATSSLRLLPPILTRYQKLHPLVEVFIEEANDHMVVQWLLERRVELGFVVLPDERFDVLPLAEDELVAVLPASHPLAIQTAISAKDLARQPFIRTSAGSGLYIDAFFSNESVKPTTLFRLEQLTSIMGFVAQGVALTIAARLALPEPPTGVVYRPLKPASPRKIALAALRFDKLSPAALAFVETAKKSRSSWVLE